MIKERCLTWQRTEFGGETLHHDYAGVYDGKIVARVVLIQYGPQEGQWTWSVANAGSGHIDFNERRQKGGGDRSMRAALLCRS